MVHAPCATARKSPGPRERMKGKRCPFSDLARLIVGLGLFIVAGCALVPRSRMDECQKLTQALRADNARLKDRILTLQSQNRDYAERAVDDARRLAVQDEAIERLEHSMQAYQDERARLEAAYRQLAASLGASAYDGAGASIEQDSRTTSRVEAGAPRSARNPRKSPVVDAESPR